MQNIAAIKKRFIETNKYPSLRINAVLFDMDGVLYDSMPFHAKAWVDALSAVGVNFSERDVYMNEGSRGSETVQTAYVRQFGHTCPEEEEQEIYKEKSRIFESLGEPPVMPGANAVVSALMQRGVKRTVVTGSGEKSTIKKLQTSFPNAFAPENIVTAYETKKGKPNPECYLRGLEKLNMPAHYAMVVENAPLGVMAAKNAGIFTVAINTGILTDDDLRQAGADIVFKDLTELKNAFDELID
ncbi:MAG: HAD-IA family hydrolase [Paludibacteraceae bacterium]|nr:HAD-IA family hydrolase [Paludibacteraceae bacterium]MBP5136674.1 HAD-IA family hydrolase [Paludibacteraceae bacterium]MBP5743157.1 HAD-IA family hydrolase [Paludibacteraceae bacterium]